MMNDVHLVHRKSDDREGQAILIQTMYTILAGRSEDAKELLVRIGKLNMIARHHPLQLSFERWPVFKYFCNRPYPDRRGYPLRPHPCAGCEQSRAHKIRPNLEPSEQMESLRGSERRKITYRHPIGLKAVPCQRGGFARQADERYRLGAPTGLSASASSTRWFH